MKAFVKRYLDKILSSHYKVNISSSEKIDKGRSPVFWLVSMSTDSSGNMYFKVMTKSPKVRN